MTRPSRGSTPLLPLLCHGFSLLCLLADVCLLADYVRYTPGSRHSLADVRYRADFVRFTPSSGRGWHPRRMSQVDPTVRTCGAPAAVANWRTNRGDWHAKCEPIPGSRSPTPTQVLLRPTRHRRCKSPVPSRSTPLRDLPFDHCR